MVIFIKKILLLSFAFILLSGCGSDVDPGVIEGAPRTSEAIYEKDLKFFRTKDGIFKRRGRDKNGFDHSTAYFWYSDSHDYDNRLKVKETAQEYVNEHAQRYFENYLHEAVYGKS